MPVKRRVHPDPALLGVLLECHPNVLETLFLSDAVADVHGRVVNAWCFLVTFNDTCVLTARRHEKFFV
jgi:hypothetical protein